MGVLQIKSKIVSCQIIFDMMLTNNTTLGLSMLNKTAYSEQNNNAKLRSEISLSLCIKEKDSSRNSEFIIMGRRIKKHIK